MNDEVSALLADELKYYEEHIDDLLVALDNVLDHTAEHRRVVLRMIGSGYGKWDLLMSGIRRLYRPAEVSAGDALSGTLNKLAEDELIELTAIHRGWHGRSRKYFLTAKGKSEVRRAA